MVGPASSLEASWLSRSMRCPGAVRDSLKEIRFPNGWTCVQFGSLMTEPQYEMPRSCERQPEGNKIPKWLDLRPVWKPHDWAAVWDAQVLWEAAWRIKLRDASWREVPVRYAFIEFTSWLNRSMGSLGRWPGRKNTTKGDIPSHRMSLVYRSCVMRAMHRSLYIDTLHIYFYRIR